MNRYKNIVVVGRKGFLGSALTKKLEMSGATVSSTPTKDTEIVYHFGSPTHMAYNLNPSYHLKAILDSFLYFLPFCEEFDIKFVYASSALVYEKDTPFGIQKKILEMMAGTYPKTLGLRIFPTYGVGEHHTFPSQAVREMKMGYSPVVYGDGTQKRDFIYIDDAIDQIIELSQDKTGIADIGAGNPLVFNDIIKAINEVMGKNIKPEYIPLPAVYPQGIVCQNPLPTKVSIHEAIQRILEQSL